jgi:hypothetical protein
MLGGNLMTGRNRYYCKDMRQSAAQWLSDAATHYFRPEACPAARATLRESDEERSCAGITDTLGNDPEPA